MAKQVMDNIVRDNWDSFYIHTSRRRTFASTSSNPSNRCSKLVESGNLSKAFNLLSASSVTSSLSADETIRILKSKHPSRHVESFTPAELDLIDRPLRPDQFQLPNFVSPISLHSSSL